jgi:hypothetical protein
MKFCIIVFQTYGILPLQKASMPCSNLILLNVAHEPTGIIFPEGKLAMCRVY